MKKGLLSKLGAVALCLVVIILVITACAPATNAPVSSPTPATPKYGGTLRVGLRDVPSTLDTLVTGTSQAGSTYAILKSFTQTLVRWSGKSDAVATLAPLAAKSWEVSPDGLSWTFHLQPGVKFQNLPPMNGREMTADDWAYSFNWFNNPANKQAMRISYDIKNVEVLDKYTLKLTTNTKVPGILVYLNYYACYPKEIIEASGGPANNPVGVGPFILTDFDKTTKAILKKNPDYWEKGKPYLDKVEYYFMPDAAARLAAFRAGQLDVLPKEGKTNRDAILRTVPNADIQDGIYMSEVGLLLNNKRTPLDNKLVRQAIQYAIDCDGIIKAALDGAGVRTSYLATQWKDWGAPQMADMPKRDVAKAKELLAKAGYSDGFKMTILQNSGSMEQTGNAVEPVVAMLKDVGIQATIVPLDNASFISKWRSKDYDMAVHSLLTGRPYDVNNSIQQQWYSKGSYNFLNYSNPQVDELVLSQQSAFPDTEKRKAIVKQLMLLLGDDVPSVPLYIAMNYFIKQPYVKGWDDMADANGNNSTGGIFNVWLDK